MKMKNIVILGSTGSIGVNALDVVRRYSNDFNVVGLAANKNVRLILRQIQEFKPKVVAMADTPSAEILKKALAHQRIRPEVWNHSDGVDRLAKIKEASFVLCGIVGAQGLTPLVAALKSGKTVGLANKEALIIAGATIAALSKKYKAQLIPVDSEHSAIYQCLRGHEGVEISRIILTASGGPFYRYEGDLNKINVEQALNHPTWKMGKKITVDSATLMNKGLEAIEAHLLFGVPMEKISIVIHPQSIVHSLVEFSDGAHLAQLSHPDMRLPIQYAMTHPRRIKTSVKPLDLAKVGRLDFAEPDFSRFPCLQLALSAGRRGGTAPTALSSSNEVAVRAFIDKKISFMAIPKVVAGVLKKHKVRNSPTLDDVLEVDNWARIEAQKIIERKGK
ncbi:MAG: 1-deoxy-D-xylulose 5-phosphate reductoisomerase [Elusimicrobia bacterium]|nr:1-deoxy-D-xylulose 5-phosphate reductoisomerase [Elusimicrobiota bacterium]